MLSYSFLIFVDNGHSLILQKQGELGSMESDFLENVDENQPCSCFFSFETFVIAIDFSSHPKIGSFFYHEKLGYVLYAEQCFKKSEMDLEAMYAATIEKHPHLAKPQIKSARSKF